MANEAKIDEVYEDLLSMYSVHSLKVRNSIAQITFGVLGMQVLLSGLF